MIGAELLGPGRSGGDSRSVTDQHGCADRGFSGAVLDTAPMSFGRVNSTGSTTRSSQAPAWEGPPRPHAPCHRRTRIFLVFPLNTPASGPSPPPGIPDGIASSLPPIARCATPPRRPCSHRPEAPRPPTPVVSPPTASASAPPLHARLPGWRPGRAGCGRSGRRRSGMPLSGSSGKRLRRAREARIGGAEPDGGGLAGKNRRLREMAGRQAGRMRDGGHGA